MVVMRLSPLPLAAFVVESRRGRRRRRKGSLRERPSRARLRRGGGPTRQRHSLQTREPSSPHCQKGARRPDEREKPEKRKKK